MGRNIPKKLIVRSNKIIRSQAKNTIDLPKELTVSQLNKKLMALRNRGLKPFIKGKGGGTIKLGFE